MFIFIHLKLKLTFDNLCKVLNSIRNPDPFPPRAAYILFIGFDFSSKYFAFGFIEYELDNFISLLQVIKIILNFQSVVQRAPSLSRDFHRFFLTTP